MRHQGAWEVDSHYPKASWEQPWGQSVEVPSSGLCGRAPWELSVLNRGLTARISWGDTRCTAQTGRQLAALRSRVDCYQLLIP